MGVFPNGMHRFPKCSFFGDYVWSKKVVILADFWTLTTTKGATNRILKTSHILVVWSVAVKPSGRSGTYLEKRLA